MKTRNFALTLSGLALAAASFAASADILFQNLGTSAPPATVGSHAVSPFDLQPQNAIADFSIVDNIPGSPKPGTLSIAPSISKISFLAIPFGHGYTGPSYADTTFPNTTTFTLTLPENTHAFYFYAISRQIGVSSITATTSSGTTSGAVTVTTDSGENSANGFAFHSTAGENIASITITSTQGVILADFGIDTAPATTCASEGYKGAQLTWCKNICENGLSGQVLDTWIHRWINRYRDLPYCAVEGGEGSEGGDRG